MSDGFLDTLSGAAHERMKRLKERSPREYEKLRKAAREHGPEYAKEQMKVNAEFAEIALELKMNPEKQEKARESISKAAREQGIEAVIDGSLDQATKSALEKGQFDVSVDATDEGHQVSVLPKANDKSSSTEAPSGNVAEKLPLKKSFQDAFVASFLQKRKK